MNTSWLRLSLRLRGRSNFVALVAFVVFLIAARPFPASAATPAKKPAEPANAAAVSATKAAMPASMPAVSKALLRVAKSLPAVKPTAGRPPQPAMPSASPALLGEPKPLSSTYVGVSAPGTKSATKATASRPLPVDGGGDNPPPAPAPPPAIGGGQATPLALVSGDFNEDGYNDLAVGYAAPGGGLIAIHRGNIDAFAPQSDATFQAMTRGEFPSPFLTNVQVFAVPVAPNFIATGTFTSSGNPDLIIAARGDNAVYLLPGDGAGNFGAPQKIDVQGAVTALAAGNMGGGAYTHLVVGISVSSQQSDLVVLKGSDTGMTALQVLALDGPASNILFGNFGGGPDAIFLVAGKPVILRSSLMQLSKVDLPVSATAMALGHFIYDRNRGLQIALLANDGSIQIATSNDFDPRVYTIDEFQAIRRAKLNHQPLPSFYLPASFPVSGWKIAEGFPAVVSTGSGQTPLLFSTRISSHGADDVMVLDGASAQMVVLSHPDGAPGAPTFLPGEVSLTPYSGTPVAALPVRVNADGRPGVIALHQGEVAPSTLTPVMGTAPATNGATAATPALASSAAPTAGGNAPVTGPPLGPALNLTVNRNDDPVPASPITNACNGVANDCSLREAVLRSNANTGVTNTINLPAGTYTLTIGRIASPAYDANHGTLNINNSVNILGGGQATTIITWGTLTSGNSVDMIMAVNEDFTPTSATGSISNLTIQNGVNNGSDAVLGDGDGGCMEFDTGSAGTSSLTLTNVTIQNCATTNGNGGGIVLFDSIVRPGTGTVSISNSTFQNNAAVDTTFGAAGGGLGISAGSLVTITNTTVTNNTANHPAGGQEGEGGGIRLDASGAGTGFGNVTIHSSTISNNSAGGLGGGISDSGMGLTIDQGTVISGNHGGLQNVVNTKDGGGIYVNTFALPGPTFPNTLSFSHVVIINNTATGNGGGISTGNAGAFPSAGPMTMSFSRLAGNTAASGSNLNNSGTTVTATNNWWGTNAASTTINTIDSGVTTFDPFIVLTHTGVPDKIKINTSSALTGTMANDNHGNAVGLANLTQIIGLPITFDGAVLGTIPQVQPETLNASAQATATFNAGGTSGFGTANATVDQAVVPVNSNLIATATESGTTATITTIGAIGFSTGDFVRISGVSVPGYNGSPATQEFKVLSTPTATSFTYTANTAALGPATGGTANAGIIILQPPSITKVFNPTAIQTTSDPGTSVSTITFAITNGNIVPINASFSDTLPTNLVVAATPNVVNNCIGGTVTAPAAATHIDYTNTSSQQVGTCTITVNVSSAVDNQYSNSVTIDSTDAGNGNTTPAATLVVVHPPHIAKAFGASTIPQNGTTSLTITVSSSNVNLVLNGVAFNDSLPAGLVVATPGNLVSTCSGTATAADGSSSVSLSGASLAVGTSCTVTVNVQGTTAGVKSNSVSVSATTDQFADPLGAAGNGNTATASVTVVAPPTISKAFGAASIPLNGTTTMTFTITNPNTTIALTGIAFSDTVPANLQMIGFGSAGDTCGGVTSPGASTVSYSALSVPASSSCFYTVTVKGIAAGNALNTTSAITSTEGGTGTTSNTATLTVVAPPTISKAFGASSIPLNGTTTVTFTITNPAANTVAETGIAFSDTLTNGLTVANTPGVTNSCNGTVTAAANTTTISLSGGSIATPGNTCTIVVNVTGTVAGTVSNTTGAVSSTNGGTGATSNTATLLVVSPVTIAKAFNPTSIPLNANSTLTFTITNPSTVSAQSGIAFTDTLPAGVVVATPNGLTGSCGGGTITATAASGSISLSGGTLTASPAAGSSCTFSVNVTGTTAGNKSNTTSTISSTEGGTGNTASANLAVIAPPSISKLFNPPSIALNATTSLQFTITNPAPNTISLTGVGFTDTLPTGLTVASSTSTVCGGTLTTTAPTSISLTGATIAASGNCAFNVTVTGATAGGYANTTGAVTSTEGGTGNTATANLTVVAPPTISKAFGAPFIALNGTTTVTFTITNPAANTTAETGIAFSDTLTGGLQVASTPGVTNTCGGTVTAAANSTSISLTGGAIVTPGNTCTIVVNVTGTLSGTVSNTTGTISSTNGGTGATSNTATLTVASPPSINKSFNPTSIPVNTNSTLSFTITNPNTNVALTGVAFTDTLPAGVVVATPNGLTGTCGSGTITAVAASGSISLSGGTLAVSPGAGSSCTFSVNVTGTTAGTKSNSVQVTSTEGGTGNTSNATLTVVAPPTISKAFNPTSIALNANSTLTFTITNPNTASALSGVAFTDTLPAGVVVATPNGVTGSCGTGTITAVAASGSISLSGGTLTASPAAGSTCTFSVNVTGTTAGTKSNTTGAINSTEGGTGTTSNTATLTVVAPPTISKAFGAANISLNGTTTVTFTITNPAANTTAETGIAFSDTLTGGLQVASTPGVTNTCGGTVTAAANSTSISLTGGAIVTPGNTCTIVVNVTGTLSGTVSNTTGTISSTNGGTGATSNTATLTVASPPSINKSFNPTSIPVNTNSTLTFTITNPNTNVALTGVAFTDTLPAGVVVATPNGLTGSCGSGTITAVAASGSITLSGGTLAVSPGAGSSCTFSVNVTGTTAGTKNNSVQVTSTEGGTGNTSNATLTVVGPATISKAFNPTSVALNANSTLTFTIVNGNTASALSGVGFTDTLPAGVVVATPPNVTGSCGAGTITAVAASGSISLSGGTLTASPAAGSTCTFSVDVTGTSAGSKSNTTSAVTSTEGGTGTVSNTAVLTVVAPPSIAKAFNPTTIALNGTTSLTFTITNPAANTAPENGVAFTDTLPTGLTVASSTSTVCGGTLTLTNPTSISLTGATIAVGGNCQFSVTVTGAVSGNYTNTTGAVTSTNGGTGNTATANLTVASPPSITKNFGAASIPLNGSTTLTFAITNPNTNTGLTGVAFTDTLPAGLQVATPNGLTGSCGSGTITAIAGTGVVSLSGGTLTASPAAGSSCTFTVNVTGITAGVQNNSVQVSSTEGGTGNTSNASITVVSPPVIIKAFGAASIPLGGTTTLQFTIQNNNAGTALTGVAFSDTLPAGLVVATPNGLTGNTCGATPTAVAGGNSVSLSGGTIAANTSCTFTINVTGTAAGTQTNTTGQVTSNEGGTGGTATTSITVVAPPSIAKVFTPGTISLNGTTSLTFTITNPAANTVAENGVAFTDTLPTGLTVASSTSTVCGGTLTITNPTSISLTGATIAVGGNCQFSVTVTGTVSGNYTNTTGAVSSTNGGTGNTATANLTVASPPSITKSFNPISIATASGGTAATSSVLSFTIQNPNATVALSGVAFTDTLPAGLVVATPNGLTGSCGAGVITATAGSGVVSLSGGTLAATASCTFSVNVVGTTPGVKNNAVQVTSTEGGTGNTSNASITVVAPPVIIKAFGAASVPVSGTTSLQFTIQNNNGTTTLTGVGFTDALPAGLVVATPNGLTGNTCSTTPTAVAGSSSVSLSGASLNQSTSCTFTINVTGTAGGTKTNTTSQVTSNEGGTGGTATAFIDVVAPPSIAKAFGATGIPLNGTTSLTFTITNPAVNGVAENGVAFTDTLPTGLVVSTPNGLSNNCGGTATAVANTTSITLTGGSIATPGTTCTVVVNVTGAVSGNYTNTTGAVSSTNGGTGNTATANLSVAQPPSIVKAFGAATIPQNSSTSLSFTITNPAINTIPLTVAFTDTLPAGLVVATPNGLTNTCGGTVTATAGSGSVSLSGGTVAINSTCTLTVNITGTTAGVKNNSVQVTSTQGGAGNTSNASITVVAPPSITKAFGVATLPVGSTTSLTLTISNPNPGVTLTGVAVTDNMPFGLNVDVPSGATNTCGGTATVSPHSFSLSGGTLAPSASCTVTVTVRAVAGGGVRVNTTGNVTSTNGGTGNTASASITVPGPPLNIALTVTGGGNVTINPGDTATFVFTVNSGDPALGGINFSCNTPQPAGATCTFDSQGETQSSAQVTLTYSTTAPHGPTTASNQPPQGRGTAPLAALLLPVFGVVGLTQFRRGKKGKNLRLRLALWLGGLVLLLALAGCGGHSTSLLSGGGGNGGTPAGLYPITVTATSSAQPSVTATANVTVSVR